MIKGSPAICGCIWQEDFFIGNWFQHICQKLSCKIGDFFYLKLTRNYIVHIDNFLKICFNKVYKLTNNDGYFKYVMLSEDGAYVEKKA